MRVVCEGCSSQSCIYETNFGISLALPYEDTSLESCLTREFSTTERMEGAYMYVKP
jgi:ubiquitin C-terminal hydrolase